jgi:hypothetical protein
MFEEDSIDIACPQCGHWNSIPVRIFEDDPETHFMCEHCKAGVKVEANEFRAKLGEVRNELEVLERGAATQAKKKRPRKGDFQI